MEFDNWQDYERNTIVVIIFIFDSSSGSDDGSNHDRYNKPR